MQPTFEVMDAQLAMGYDETCFRACMEEFGYLEVSSGRGAASEVADLISIVIGDASYM